MSQLPGYDGQTAPTFSPENCWTMLDQNVGSVYLILTLYFRNNIEKKIVKINKGNIFVLR